MGTLMNCKTLTLDELECQGYKREEFRTQLKIKYQGKIFVRLRDFPKKFRNQAIELCQGFRESQVDSFLVETGFSITVWQEENSQTKQNKLINISPELLLTTLPKRDNKVEVKYRKNYRIEKSGVVANITQKKDGQPAQTKVKMYRGVAINDSELQDCSNKLQQSDTNEQIRTKKVYRGQEYWL